MLGGMRTGLVALVFTLGSSSEALAQSLTIAPVGPFVVTMGNSVTFQITASSNNGYSIQLIAQGLPTGALFPPPTPSNPVTGTFTWTPTFNQAGTYQITFLALDGVDSDTLPVDIQVQPNNHAPVIDAGPDRAIGFTPPNTLTFTVVSTDPDGGPLTLSVSPWLPNSTFVDNQDNTGTYTITPAPGQEGVYVLDFSAEDTLGARDTDSMRLTIGVPPVTPGPIPVAAVPSFEYFPLTYEVTEGEQLVVQLVADVGGDEVLTFSGVDLPAGATVSGSGVGRATGTFEWTPSLTQSGTYLINMIAGTALAEARASFSVRVFDVPNHPPHFDGVLTQTVGEGDLVEIDLRAEDPDASDTLEIGADDLPKSAELASVAGNPSTAKLLWTIPVGASLQSPYELRLFAQDDGTPPLRADLTVKVEVVATNHKPDLFVAKEHTALVLSPVRFEVGGSDPDGDAVAIFAEGLPKGASFKDGVFYWPSAEEGSWIVSFTAKDDGDPPLSDFESVRILVVNEEAAGCDCRSAGGQDGLGWLLLVGLGVLVIRRTGSASR